MKKIIVLFVASILLVPCQAQKLNLGLDLSIGETYSQKNTLDISNVQTINGQKSEIKMVITKKISYKVIAQNNGVYNLEGRFDFLSMSMIVANGGSPVFSSEKTGNADPFSAVMSAMKNKPFTVKIAKTGKVVEIDGVDKIITEAFGVLSQLPDNQKDRLQSMLMQAFGEKIIKDNLQNVTEIFPESSVSEGDKWVVKSQLQSVSAVNQKASYELKNVNDSICTIIGTSKLETVDNKAYVETNGASMKYDLNGTMNAVIKLNKKTGWVSEAKILQDVEGSSQLKETTQYPKGIVIPLVRNVEMTVSQ
jgi:hypothetical protein